MKKFSRKIFNKMSYCNLCNKKIKNSLFKYKHQCYFCNKLDKCVNRENMNFSPSRQIDVRREEAGICTLL